MSPAGTDGTVSVPAEPTPQVANDEWLAPPWSSPYRIVRADLASTIARARPYMHGVLLDLACGPKPYAPLVRDRVDAHWGVDLSAWSGSADVVADICRLPFADGVVDTVLCTEGLEHVPQPGAVMAEMRRVLAPGGIVVLTTPMTWGLHAEPHDYWRFTAYGLRQLAAENGLRAVAMWQRGGGAKLVGQMIARKAATALGPGEARFRTRLIDALLRLSRPVAAVDARIRRRSPERSQVGLRGTIGRIEPGFSVVPHLVAAVNRGAVALDQRVRWSDETIGFTVVLAAEVADRDAP